MTYDGHEPSYTVIYLYSMYSVYDVIYFSEKYMTVYTKYRISGKVYDHIYSVYDPISHALSYGVIY